MAKRRKVRVEEYKARDGASRTFAITARINRRGGGSKKNAFEACVYTQRAIPFNKAKRIANQGHECATGSSPRRALGNALKRLGAVYAHRSSAFAGLH